MRSFYISQKKDLYIKHIKRLQVIYDNTKTKRNLKKQLQTMDRLISNSHRIHEISNRSKIVQWKQNQMNHTSRDWNSVHSHVNSLPKDLGRFSIPKIAEKNKKQKYELNKKNFDFLKRLLNVKPTINPLKTKLKFRAKDRLSVNNKQNKNGDFINILNLSQIKKEQCLKLCVRINSLKNQQIVKIKFSSEIQQILKQNKIYYLVINTQIPKRFTQINQSECFSLKQLLKGQLIIYKRKNDQINMIQIRQLILNETQSISKGHLNFKGFLNENTTQPDQYVQFFSTSGKRTTSILVHIQKRQIKKKIHRFSRTFHNPNNNNFKQIQNQNSNPIQN